MADVTPQAIRAAVYEVLEAITLRAASEIHDDDDLIADLKIDSDDLSMWMIPELERRFRRRTTQQNWDHAATVRDVIAVFEQIR